MQHLTYLALYVLLGLAALAYTAHELLKNPAALRILSRLAHRRRRLRPVQEGDHRDPAG